MKTTRPYCKRCRYPQNTCVCFAISKIPTSIQISILQDPSETKHPKNTARLLPLLLSEAHIYTGHFPCDFERVRQRVSLSQNNLVLFPNANAVSLNEESDAVDCDHLILLDGSWRKAKKLWFNNPWLHDLPSVALVDCESSEYFIRATRNTNSLSTLEAASLILSNVEKIPRAPFVSILNAMQSHWQRHASRKD